MEPHQQRVIDEQIELNERLTKLSAFIASSPVFESLSVLERQRLKEQEYHMTQYLNVLGRRIAAFGDPNA